LFTIATRGVSLWHFHTIWFISSIFVFFLL
jgi:hypothetical protein